jgi:hypothetical protein
MRVESASEASTECTSTVRDAPEAKMTEFSTRRMLRQGLYVMNIYEKALNQALSSPR